MSFITTYPAKLMSALLPKVPDSTPTPVTRLTPSAPILDAAAYVNPRWATTTSFIPLKEARASETISRRPVALLIPEERVTHIELSWSPLVTFVSLDEAQKSDVIRRRTVELL